MRLTERQLRLAVREMILREGFLDKIIDFFSSSPEKMEKMSGTNERGFGKHDNGKYRYPMIAEYCYESDGHPGRDGSDDEWEEYFGKKHKMIKDNAKYVKNFIKEMQGILGEARRR